MDTIIFGEDKSSYKVGILIKQLANDPNEIRKCYLSAVDDVLAEDDVISFGFTPSGKKLSRKEGKDFLDEVGAMVKSLGITTLLVADSELVKILTKGTKADVHYGNCTVPDYAGFDGVKMVAIPNYTSIIHNDQNIEKIALSLTALRIAITGLVFNLGRDIIKEASYPVKPHEIQMELLRMKEYPELWMDIEAYSLKFYEAGFGTLALCYDEGKGIAFCVDHNNTTEDAKLIRKMVKEFFMEYTGKAYWHNGSYDLTVLAYELFMGGLGDYMGILDGIDVMCKNWVDTKVEIYLATNSAGGNTLGLKQNAHEYAGNYAEDDIKDINLIPTPRLLEYNLKDALCTRYVHFKSLPEIRRTNQEDLLSTLFMPALKNIIHMQLSGMPINMEKVLHANEVLVKDRHKYLTEIMTDSKVKYVTDNKRNRHITKRNAKLKTKQITSDDAEVQAITFNPNSSADVIDLVYGLHNMPVIARTKSKQPATGADVLERLQAHCTKKPETAKLMKALVNFAKVEKILTSFIPKFMAAKRVGNCYYIYGNFNLGGTISGRLSSSDPNLQNIPATGSPHAKLIKECFMTDFSGLGELMVGLDFNALEVRVDTLLTKDPIKMDILQAGYDGHSFNAWHYWESKFPPEMKLIKFDEIEEVTAYKEVTFNGTNYYRSDALPDEGEFTPVSYREYNKQKTEDFSATYKKTWRQDSKPVTFALQYQAIPITLVNNSGFSLQEATDIWNNYHTLYKISTEYTKNRIKRAAKDGFIRVAFGLVIRTPLLKKFGYMDDGNPFMVDAEARSIGNAISQSWGLLNTRAAVEVATELEKPENRWLRESIRPIAHIHDAQYYITVGNTEVIAALNDLLQKAVKWNNHPEIYHSEVGLGGNLSIFCPSWYQELELPEVCTPDEVGELFTNFMEAA